MPPAPINRTFAPLQALVDELARCGVRRAVTCPGSRNAPLILSLVGDGRLECVSVLDERAGGFMALGMAKAGGRPWRSPVRRGRLPRTCCPRSPRHARRAFR